MVMPADPAVVTDVNVPAGDLLDTGRMISIHRPVFVETGPRLGTVQAIKGAFTLPVTLHLMVVTVVPFNVQGLLEHETVEMVALGVPRKTPLVFVKVVVTVTSTAGAAL